MCTENFLFSSTFFSFFRSRWCGDAKWNVYTNKLVCLSFVFRFVSHCMLNIYYIFYFPLSFLVLLSCVLDFHLVYSGTLLLARKNLLNIFYVHGTGYTRTHYTDTSINCMGERLTTVSIKSEKRSRSSRWSDQICVDIASFAKCTRRFLIIFLSHCCPGRFVMHWPRPRPRPRPRLRLLSFTEGRKMKMMNVNEMNQQKFNVCVFLKEKEKCTHARSPPHKQWKAKVFFAVHFKLTICENELQMNTKILFLCTLYIFIVNSEIETNRCWIGRSAEKTQLKMNLGDTLDVYYTEYFVF